MTEEKREAALRWLRSKALEMEQCDGPGGASAAKVLTALADKVTFDMAEGKAAPLKAADGVPGDLCIRVDIRVVDDSALSLLAEARKLVKKMVKAEEIGAQEAQFCVGAVRVTTSRATDKGAGR